VSDREFQEAADAVYAEIAEALEAAVEPVLCLAAVGRMLVELARARGGIAGRWRQGSGRLVALSLERADHAPALDRPR
jgi:hypothetical protein